MQRNQQHIDQRPNAQTAKTEQLADAFLPMPQKEPVNSESTQRDAQNQRRRPAVTLRPIARNLLHESPVTHTQDLPIYGAVGFVLGIDRVAATFLFAKLFPPFCLVAIPANGFAPHFGSARPIGNTAYGRFWTASYVDFRSVNALRVVLAV